MIKKMINYIKNNDVECLKNLKRRDFLDSLYSIQRSHDICKICVQYKSFEALVYLKENGLNINNMEYNPLLDAVKTKDLRFVKFFLESGLNPNKETSECSNLLYRACEDENRDYDIVKILFDYGVYVNKKSRYGDLIAINALCSSTNNEDLTRYFSLFLNNNCNLDNIGGLAPIITACKFKNYQAVEFLISQNCCLDRTISLLDEYIRVIKTPLTIACKNEDLKLVEMLLNGGASVKTFYLKHIPHVIMACIKNNLEILKLLLFKGADKEEFYMGMKPLHWCAKQNSYECAEFLLKNTRFVDCFDDYKTKTPLFFAIKFNFLRMIKLFVEHGADVNYDTKFGNGQGLCLREAIYNKNKEAIIYLIKNGARKNDFLRSSLFADEQFSIPWNFKNHSLFPYYIQEKIFTILLIELRTRTTEHHFYIPIEIWFYILNGLTVKYLQ